MQIKTRFHSQGGMTLIESLISILIFSIGILGLAGLQANAINMSTDAKYRADAAFLANNLIGQMSVADPTTSSFTHPTSTPAILTNWLTQVNATLPNAGSANQQVTFNSANKVLSITIRWRAPNGTQHSHAVTTQLQWQ